MKKMLLVHPLIFSIVLLLHLHYPYLLIANPLTFLQFDSFDGTTYFNDNNTVGGITEVREPRLAIEGDIHLSTIPSASSCLSDFQQLPNAVYCAFEAVSEKIDEWRSNLVTIE